MEMNERDDCDFAVLVRQLIHHGVGKSLQSESAVCVVDHLPSIRKTQNSVEGVAIVVK